VVEDDCERDVVGEYTWLLFGFFLFCLIVSGFCSGLLFSFVVDGDDVLFG